MNEQEKAKSDIDQRPNQPQNEPEQQHEGNIQSAIKEIAEETGQKIANQAQVLKEAMIEKQQKAQQFLDSTNGQIFVAEILGTALLTYGSIASGGWHPYVAGTLFISILITVHWSGGHLNPIVSLAFYMQDQMDLKRFFVYLIAQLIGAALGACLASFWLQTMACPYIPIEESIAEVLRDIIALSFGAFMLIIIILILTNEHCSYAQGNMVLTIATICLGLYIAQQISSIAGGEVNPTIAVVLEIAQSFYDLDGTYLVNFYVYLIGPTHGAVMAVLFFRNVFLKSYMELTEVAQRNKSRSEQ